MHYHTLPHTTTHTPMHYHTLPHTTTLTTTHYHTVPHTTTYTNMHYHTLPHTTTLYHTLPHTTTNNHILYHTLPDITTHYQTHCNRLPRARARAHGNVLYLSSRTLFWSFFVLLKLLESSKGPPILCPRPPVLWTKYRPRRCPPCPIVLQNSICVSKSPLLRRGSVISLSVPQASISRPVWCLPVSSFSFTPPMSSDVLGQGPGHILPCPLGQN